MEDGAVPEDDLRDEVGVLRHEHPADGALVPGPGLDGLLLRSARQGYREQGDEDSRCKSFHKALTEFSISPSRTF